MSDHGFFARPVGCAPPPWRSRSRPRSRASTPVSAACNSTARDQDRSATVAPDAKILDEKGAPLADGLKAEALKAGTVVVLTVERENDLPVIHGIRLGGEPPAGTAESQAKAKNAGAQPAVDFKFPDTTKLVPLTDLGTGKYEGFEGGLYPDGTNTRPASHEAAGLALARQSRAARRRGEAEC